MIDIVAHGQPLEKTYDDRYTLLNQIGQGNPKWKDDIPRSEVKNLAGMTNMECIRTLAAQLASFQNQMIT